MSGQSAPEVTAAARVTMSDGSPIYLQGMRSSSSCTGMRTTFACSAGSDQSELPPVEPDEGTSMCTTMPNERES